MPAPLGQAKTLVNGMSDAALVLDAELRIVHFNPSTSRSAARSGAALEKMLAEGREPLQAVGLEGGLISQRRECVITKQPVRLAELPFQTESGQTLTVLVTMIPIIEDDKVTGVIEYLRDVTDDARVQQRYRELLDLEQARAAELERQVEERTRELQVALEEVTRLSRTDPLTALLNRRSFNEHAAQALTMAARHERSLALIIGDLDHFKKVNDTFGHKVGDLVLIATAQAITGAVRSCDHVARFGGEEFVVLLTETEPAHVMTVANRICEAVRQIDMATLSPAARGKPSISLGVAVFPEHGDNLEELVSRADDALYHVKENGRNHAELYVDSIMGTPVPAVPPPPRKAVLAVGGGWLEESGYQDALREDYELMQVETAEQAAALCRQRAFDVVIAGHKDGRENGAEALAATLHDRPAALRLLIIDDEEMFLGARGAAAAQVDYFLLHADVRAHVGAAIEDGLVRKDMSRQVILRGSGRLSVAYAAHMQRLERLLQARELRFVYQPIVRRGTRDVYAQEALCRASDPLFRDPNVLFDAAVQRGAIWRLGRLVRQIAPGPLTKLPEEQCMFVNLHPAEVADPELEQSVDPMLSKRVVFELTERGAIPDLARFRESIDRLRDRGFRIAIDDLGAGYASLNAVALLEPDFLKIDMTIIRGIEESLSRSRLVRRIVEFADDQGIQVIAEGVETEAEADVVERLGCHLLQGYYFGRPREL